MAGSYYDFDAPAFQDFTADNDNSESTGDDWFHRREEGYGSAKKFTRKLNDGKEQKRGSGKREQCPSPTKKQKICHGDGMSTHKNSTPRRSPRVLSKPKPAGKPSNSPPKSKTNSLTRTASHPNVALSGSVVSEKGKHTPTMKGGLENVKGKSSEELELEKIAALKEKLAASRKRNQESYKAAMTSKGLVPLKSGQPATFPEGFHFHSDQRIRGLPRRVPETKVKEFTSTLRSNSSKSAFGKEKGQKELTRPQPFKLSQAKSTSSLQAAEKYQSVAERVAAFHSKTPERFKTKEAKRPNSAKKSPHLTLAKTPTLTTRARTRSVKVISRDEEEEVEYKKHQKQQFKAHPVNHKILDVPNLGVQKVAPKPPTVPQEFNLHQNCHSQIQLPEEDEAERQFHANPVNKKILEGPVGVRPVEPLPLTVAQSPAFALRSRVRLHAPEPQQETVPMPPKSHHVQHTGVPFKPRLEHIHTKPQPFAVEQRSKEMLKKREEKIMQVYEEEKKARQFCAKLLPSDVPDTLPPKQTRPLTAPEPFKLEIDYRGQRYQEEYKQKIEEETKQAKSQAEFKARPNKVIFKTPFLPEKSAKPLTEVDSFALNTDVRAEQREQYNQLLKAHEAEVTALKRQIEEQREHEENMAVAKLRQDMVHKATGIRRYKSVLVRPSDKPLTEAQSPYLRTQRVTRKTSLDE